MTVDTTPRPLVSIIVWVYNLERYVSAAIDSALNQTYSQLQVILSDDCSTDGTWLIMQKASAAYRGPHRVVLNRNERNLGLIGHLNRAVDLARGELIVMLSGDDILEPDHVMCVVDAWLNSIPKRILITTPMRAMSSSGALTGEIVCSGASFSRTAAPLTVGFAYSMRVFGAGFAWHRSLYDVFGPMRIGRAFEDCIMYLRACLLDGVILLDRPTIRYRIHSAQMTREVWSHARLLRGCRGLRRICFQMLKDVTAAVAAGVLDDRVALQLRAAIAVSRRDNVILYLCEHSAGGPRPSTRAIRMAWSRPLSPRTALMVLGKRVFPQLWRRRRRDALSKQCHLTAPNGHSRCV